MKEREKMFFKGFLKSVKYIIFSFLILLRVITVGAINIGNSLSSSQEFIILDEINLKTPKAILLDFDDTLVDSWPQALNTFNDCLINLGHAIMSAEEQYKLPHIPDPELLAQITGKELSIVESVYKEAYEHHHKNPAPPLKGAFNLLELIKKKGIYTALISNKPSDLLNKTLREMGWDPYFNKIVGAGDAQKNKPAKEAVIFALEGSNISPDLGDCIWFVGDSLTDIECALNANLTPIWLMEKAPYALKFSDQPGRFAVFKCTDLEHLFYILNKL